MNVENHIKVAEEAGLFMFVVDGEATGIGTREEADNLVSIGIYEAITLRPVTAVDLA